MQFHAIQHDVVPNNTEETKKNIESLMHNASLNNGDFVVLPEMTTTGFSMKIDVISEGDASTWGCQAAQRFGVWLQVGWVKHHAQRTTNCVSICSPDGDIITTYEKIFTCNPLGEQNIIDKGNSISIVEIEGRKICPLICYDLRFPELWRLATAAGADIFTNSANWPQPRIHSWKSLLIARAMENQAQIIGCNRVGKDEVAHWGGCSIAVSEEGCVLAEANEESECCIHAVFDKKASEDWRNEFQALHDLDTSLLGNIDVHHFSA